VGPTVLERYVNRQASEQREGVPKGGIMALGEILKMVGTIAMGVILHKDGHHVNGVNLGKGGHHCNGRNLLAQRWAPLQ